MAIHQPLPHPRTTLRRRRLLALALAGCGGGMAHGRPGAAPAQSITRIVLESHRDDEAAPFRLELLRGGEIVQTTLGAARAGVADSVQRGRLAARRFDALAALILRLRFFEMDAVYADPELADGPWSQTTVTRDGQDRQVFSRDAARPAALARIEREIAAQRHWM